MTLFGHEMHISQETHNTNNTEVCQNGTSDFVSLPDPSIAMTQPYRSKRNAVVDYCQQKYSLWYHQPSPNCKPSLFMIITYITILFRVKNSTAFATDDEFDCNKRWIVRSWCAWWRDWYENRVIEPWDGAHQRAEEVDREIVKHEIP